MGRGQKYRSHPGNIELERLIEKELPMFGQASSSFDKTVVVLGIVQRFKESGGRFLKEDESGWTIVDEESARKKVSHCFRSKRGTKGSPSEVTAIGTDEALSMAVNSRRHFGEHSWQMKNSPAPKRSRAA